MTTEELQVIISAQISDLSKKLDAANKETKKFAKDGEASFEKFKKAAASVGKAVGVAMKATATAVAAGAGALVGLVESTEEYRTAQAKLTTAFEAAGSDAEQAKETYNQLYRVLGDGDVAVEAANHLAKLTTNQQDLAEWTNVCQGVYASFGDSLAIEGLTEAINHTAKLGEVQGSLADALEWSGVNVDDFNAQLATASTEAEREAMIRTTLNDLYGEAASQYEQNAKDLLEANEAQAALTDGLADLATATQPIVTIFKQELAGALQEIVPSFGLMAEGLRDMLNGVEGGEAKMEEGISGIINTILTKITEMLPSLLSVGLTIITTLLEGIVAAFPSIITTITELLPQLIEALITLIPQITGALLGALPLVLEALMEAVGLIIEGIATMLPTIVEQIVTIIPILIETLIANIPLLLEAAITLLMAVVDAVPQIIPPLLEALPGIIQSIVTMITENLPMVLDAAITLLMSIVEAIPEIIPPWLAALPDIIDSLINLLMDYLPVILDAAITLLMSIVEAIPEIIPPLVEALPDIIANIVDTLIDNLPLIIEGAVDLFMGIVEAIPQILPDLIKALGDLVGSALDTIGSLFKKVGTVISDALGKTIKSAIQGVLKAAIGIINGFISAINFAIGFINLIPGVSIRELQKLEVPKLAKGGIVDSATLAVVGEQGKEAVMPLENNTEWIDLLASKLADKIGAGGNPIVLEVDGKVFAQTSINTINRLTAQTGKLALNLY